MLTFLSLAAKKRFTVDRYEDRAVGVMTANPRGKLYISRITLDPVIEFSGERIPSPEQIADLHHLSHQECFIANSVLTDVVVAGIPGPHAKVPD
jgi:organic hydroperoxide reductase OsmC/OhrA